MSILHDPTCIAKRQNCGQEIRQVNEKFRGIIKKLMGSKYVSVTFPFVVIKTPNKSNLQKEEFILVSQFQGAGYHDEKG